MKILNYQSLLLMYLSISWLLVGLIWVIQLVHYPSFFYVSNDLFLEFHKHHTNSISIIVIPMMILELLLGAWLWMKTKKHLEFGIPVLFLLVIWGSTFLIQVPIHEELVYSKELKLIEGLVLTNWIRTIAWTIKGVWLIPVIFKTRQV